jgi:predicted acyl esterase
MMVTRQRSGLKSAIMRIEWDTPIWMSDGVMLRADIFRPNSSGQFLAYGPYGKWLAFHDG